MWKIILKANCRIDFGKLKSVMRHVWRCNSAFKITFLFVNCFTMDFANFMAVTAFFT